MLSHKFVCFCHASLTHGAVKEPCILCAQYVILRSNELINNEKMKTDNEILGWSEYKYTFTVLRRMNLRFEVSIQGDVFSVPINYDTFIAINHRFKVLA